MRTVLEWMGTIVAAAILVLAFEAEVAKPFRIPSSSMEPTLHCAKPGAWCRAGLNDRVIVNRLAYRFGKPTRGQIVVFAAPSSAARLCGAGGTFVKRLIGLPGDRVAERDGTVLIDGRPLREPYVDPLDRGHETQAWPRIPAGRYFFMGDNRAHSCDSRVWGTVPRSALVGPVVATYWPPTRLEIR